MALLDIFKKRWKEKEKKTAKEKKIISQKIKEKKEEIKIESPKIKKKIPDTAYRILSFPNITEKATFLTKENKYIFRVYSDANKTEIKKVIGDMYGVDVVDVKIINIPAKKRKFKRQIGWRKGYKKAIIKIKAGQKIEVLQR